MPPDQESEPGAAPPDKPATPRPARRGRRGGRGRRGRGRPRGPVEPREPGEPVEPAEPGEPSQPAEVPLREAAALPVESLPESAPIDPRAEPEPPSRAEPPSPPTVQGAIEAVNDIIATLTETLKEMEDVLEGLEVIERQQTAGEHELETLRRSLRHLHHGRAGGSHPRGGGHERSHRHEDDADQR